MSGGHDDHRDQREGPHVVVVPGRAEREARVDGVLLGPVEGRVEPGADPRVAHRVARELSVGAVQDEREVQAQGRADVPGSGAGRGARRRREGDEQRQDRHLIGRQPPVRAPAREVARPRADREGGEEAVPGLDRRVQPDPLVVHGRHGGQRPGARGVVAGHLGDHVAQRDLAHRDVAVGDQALGDRVGHARVLGQAAQLGQHAGGPGTRVTLDDEYSRHVRGRESGVRDDEPQRVPVADEPVVDQRDPPGIGAEAPIERARRDDLDLGYRSGQRGQLGEQRGRVGVGRGGGRFRDDQCRGQAPSLLMQRWSLHRRETGYVGAPRNNETG